MNLNEITAKFGIKVDGSGFAAIRKELNTIAAGFRAIKSEAQAQTAEFRLQTLQQRELERQEKASLRRRAQNWREFRNAVLGISASIYAVIRGTRESRENALSLYRTAFQTGINPQDIQQYQAAAAFAGTEMSRADVTSDIASLQDKITKIRFGQASAGDLFVPRLLNIVDGASTATQAIERLRNAIKGLSDVDASYLIRNMGFSPDWLLILRQSNEEFETLRKTMLSDVQLERVARLGFGFRRLGFALTTLKDQTVAFVSKPLNDFSLVMRTLAQDLSRLIKRFDTPLGFSVFATGLLLILAKISPLTAGLTILAMVLEDIYVYVKGGNSVIGLLVERFKELSIWGKMLVASGGLISLVAFFKYFSNTGGLIGGILNITSAIVTQVGNVMRLAGAWKLALAAATAYGGYKLGESLGEKLAGWMQDDYSYKGAYERLKSGELKPNVRPIQITNNMTVNADGRPMGEVNGMVDNMAERINATNNDLTRRQ